jgi:hypothetical protein
MTSVLDELASATGQAKQDLNIILAQKIAKNKNNSAVKELIAGLEHKTKSIRHDCIKTLYELAVINPEIVSPYASTFATLLEDKDNRLQWGGMTALSAIAARVPDIVYGSLNKIITTAEKGSVITRDHCVRILTALSSINKYNDTTLPLLLDQLLQAPVNQVPAYAEQILPVISGVYKNQFEKILNTRLNDIEQESKRKRIEKVLKKI